MAIALAAMHDAWSADDDHAVSTRLGGRVPAAARTSVTRYARSRLLAAGTVARTSL